MSNAPPPSIGPLKALWYNLRYAYDRQLKTGDRRAEFEHKYRQKGDYFKYRTEPYEQTKYQRTFDAMMKLRRGKESLLETGASVGVFTRMVAPEFDCVVTSDISGEALRHAAETVGGVGKVEYVRSDVISIDVGKTFDVVMVAEVLLFVREADGPKLLDMLDKHLKPDGIIVEVARADRPPDKKFFFNWDRIISTRFPILSRETHAHPVWPYEIVVYARQPA